MKLLFVTRYSMPSIRMTPFSRARNCSTDNESFSRSFGRTAFSFPTLLSQRIRRSGISNRLRTFWGNTRVMQRPALPVCKAIKKRLYASSGAASLMR